MLGGVFGAIVSYIWWLFLWPAEPRAPRGTWLVRTAATRAPFSAFPCAFGVGRPSHHPLAQPSYPPSEGDSTISFYTRGY